MQNYKKLFFAKLVGKFLQYFKIWRVMVLASTVCRIFERGVGGGRKFGNNEDQNENFPAQNQVCFPAQN